MPLYLYHLRFPNRQMVFKDISNKIVNHLKTFGSFNKPMDRFYGHQDSPYHCSGFSLWGFLKSEIYKEAIDMRETLQRIDAAVDKTTNSSKEHIME